MRADQVLQWMLDSLRRRSQAEAALALAAANGGVAALLNVGLLSPAEAAAWYERLREAAPDETGASTGDAVEVGRPSSVARSVVDVPPSELTLPTLERHEPFRGRELRSVIALGLQTLGVIELTALEIYGDGVAVRWQNRDPSPGWSPSLDLRDDIQTRYVMVGGAAHGGHGTPLAVMRGETVFVPEPASATRLQIATADHRVEIRLV